MKKIFLPTDFSVCADNALDYAINLCELLNAELVIFHSCHANALTVRHGFDNIEEEMIIDSATKMLTTYCIDHKLTDTKVKVTQMTEYGLAGDLIDAIAKGINADLIIMGTKGLNSIGSKLFGSNTMTMIEKAHCPVLAVPEDKKFGKIHQIAFATDFRESDLEAIQYLTEIAAIFNSEIILVHVNSSFVPESYEKSLFNLFVENIEKNISYKNISYQLLSGSSKSKTFKQFVHDSKIDLMAVSSRRKNIFTKIFDVSFTKGIGYDKEIPVLAFHAV